MKLIHIKRLDQNLAQAKCSVCLLLLLLFLFYSRSDLISQHEEQQTNKQTYHYIILINEQINKLDQKG